MPLLLSKFCIFHSVTDGMGLRYLLLNTPSLGDRD